MMPNECYYKCQQKWHWSAKQIEFHATVKSVHAEWDRFKRVNNIQTNIKNWIQCNFPISLHFGFSILLGPSFHLVRHKIFHVRSMCSRHSSKLFFHSQYYISAVTWLLVTYSTILNYACYKFYVAKMMWMFIWPSHTGKVLQLISINPNENNPTLELCRCLLFSLQQNSLFQTLISIVAHFIRFILRFKCHYRSINHERIFTSEKCVLSM